MQPADYTLFSITNHIFILFVTAFPQITQRAISLQKVHLWMDCSKRILWSWTSVQSDKNTCSYCPEQRVDGATDIVRYILLYHILQITYIIFYQSFFRAAKKAGHPKVSDLCLCLFHCCSIAAFCGHAFLNHFFQ